MKYILGLLLLLAALSFVFAQDQGSKTNQTRAKAKPTPSKKPTVQKQQNVNKASSTQKSTSGTKTGGSKTNAASAKPKAQTSKLNSEAEEYAKAASIDDPEQRITALKVYLEKFPTSIRKTGVLESIAITRIKLAQDKLTAAETESGIDLLKAAMRGLPVPVPKKLYNDSISKIPTDLFNNGQGAAAVEIARLIKEKVNGNAPQMITLANFFLMTENGDEAKSLAEKAIAIAPSSAAYQTLGLAHRLNFELDDASQAYEKAVELEPGSLSILRNLADLKRAQKKSDEAIELYRQILEKDAANIPAETGLVLALFDAGKRGDAETEMAKSLEQNPDNIILLAGAAYWYAAHNEPDKAIENAQKAIEKEPHYIWSHIALAHGYLAKKQPADAERILLRARNYGNFPTLEYELASARLMSGFFRDAVEELRKSFSVKDGLIHSKLGGRVDVESSNFAELLAGERRASIFEPESADDLDTAGRLKSLLEFDQVMNAPEPNAEAAAKAADVFIAGDDGMKLHRQLYAATTMLTKQVALSKVAELAEAVVGNTDAALDVPDAPAAVMASELYDSRALALSRNEMLEMPTGIPRATLSAILRGRIEEIAGWTLFNENKPAEAVVRLRRAVSVMPDKSAWWRTSMWRLGTALQADGKDAEALDSYMRSYSIDKPSAAKYVIVEALYRKVRGNTEGLDQKIGVNPAQVAQVTEVNTSAKTVTPQTSVADSSADGATKAGVKPTPKTEPTIPENVPIAMIQSTPTPETAVPTLEPTPAPVEAKPSPTIEATPTPAVDATPAPEVAPVETKPSPTIEATPTPAVDAKPVPEAATAPTPTVAVESSPSPTPEATPETTPSPTPQASPSPVIEATPSPTPEIQATPTPEATQTPEPTPTPEPSPSPTPEASPTTIEKETVARTEPLTESKIVDIRPSEQPDKGAANVKKPDDAPVGKQLFEPVIITIPKPETRKGLESNTEKKAVDAAAATNADKEKSSTSDARDGKVPDVDKEKTSSAVPDDKTAADPESGRPTVIIGNPGRIPQESTCTITVSQDSISILNNGGSLGVLVRMDGKGELRSIKAVSNSPDDLEIKVEPEIAGVRGQAFYVIRSLTTKTGDFTVAFIAPCGRKEMTVNVR